MKVTFLVSSGRGCGVGLLDFRDRGLFWDALGERLILREVDAHLIFFEDDPSATASRDLFFHRGEFFGEEISQALKGVVGEEEESLGDAGGAKATSRGEEIPDATSVFVNVGGERTILLFLTLDADEFGNSLRAAFDFALDDDLGAAAFFFVKADPDALHLDMVGEEPFLAGLELGGKPGIELLLGDGYTVAAIFGRELDEAGNTGEILFAVVFHAASDVGKILRLEAKVDSITKRPDKSEGEKDKETLHDRRVKRLGEGEPTTKLTNFVRGAESYSSVFFLLAELSGAARAEVEDE